MSKRSSVLLVGLWLVLNAAAQAPEIFRTRLAPVPIDGAMKATITGVGSVTAVLAGSKLTVTGSFEGLHGPATAAHIHQGTATGVRGAPVLNLDVSKSAAGNISGSFDLTAAQIENLKKGKWYVQIHSQAAPDGNLWGWLLK